MTLATSPQTSVSPGPTSVALPESLDDPQPGSQFSPLLCPAPTQAASHRFTREEYYQMADLGFFNDRQVELIDGVIFDMSPQSTPHADAVMRCIFALRDAFGRSAVLRTHANLRLGSSDPEPDVCVLTLADGAAMLPPTTALLVVEISLTTLAYDRGQKASLYAAAAIADYWIVNLNNQTLEVRRQPGADSAAHFGHSYGQLVTLRAPETVTPLALPSAAIAVADFFAS